MTFKIVGALNAITHPKPYVMTALWLGIGIGFGIEIVRKVKAHSPESEVIVMTGYPSYETALEAMEQSRLNWSDLSTQRDDLEEVFVRLVGEPLVDQSEDLHGA